MHLPISLIFLSSLALLVHAGHPPLPQPHQQQLQLSSVSPSPSSTPTPKTASPASVTDALRGTSLPKARVEAARDREQCHHDKHQAPASKQTRGDAAAGGQERKETLAAPSAAAAAAGRSNHRNTPSPRTTHTPTWPYPSTISAAPTQFTICSTALRMSVTANSTGSVTPHGGVPGYKGEEGRGGYTRQFRRRSYTSLENPRF